MNNVYETPKSSIDHDDEIIEYAGFWLRALASVLDTVWMLLLVLILGWFIYGESYLSLEMAIKGKADIFLQCGLPAMLVIAFWVLKAATPGKMLIRTKILDEKTMQPASLGKSVIRYIGYYVSVLPLFLGFFWAAWDKKKQCWHDKMAGTVVVKVKS